MTYLDKFKLECPDIIEQYIDKETGKVRYIFGCPYSYGYEDKICPDGIGCEECWNREIPEKQAEPKLKFEEEKKMPNLSSIIHDAVLNTINDSDIEYAVKKAFWSYDYSDMIQTAVDDYLDCNIEDIASEAVQDAVRSYMEENL